MMEPAGCVLSGADVSGAAVSGAWVSGTVGASVGAGAAVSG